MNNRELPLNDRVKPKGNPSVASEWAQYVGDLKDRAALALEVAELLGVEPTTPLPILRDRVLGSIRSLKAGNR